MKKQTTLIFTMLIAAIVTSCNAPTFYQIYKSEPIDKVKNEGDYLVYEDENCKVSYNFWSGRGNVGFSFYNKTEKNIYLNLEESFFILNGIAYNYFKNRTYTSSNNLGSSSSRTTTTTKVTASNSLLQSNKIQATNNTGLIASSGYSISYNEEKIVCIPSNTSKTITEYNINNSFYRDCDLFKYPTKKQIKVKSFSKDESPIVFSNRISYSFGQSGELISFVNGFYVSEISNHPESEILKSKYNEFCGQKSLTTTKFFKDSSPDKFYIKYSKVENSLEH